MGWAGHGLDTGRAANGLARPGLPIGWPLCWAVHGLADHGLAWPLDRLAMCSAGHGLSWPWAGMVMVWPLDALELGSPGHGLAMVWL
jgi:hypothetical protein